MEGAPQMLKGISYGHYSFGNDLFVISKDHKSLLQIPLSKISNTSVVNKQDIALELQGDDDDG